MQTSEMRRLVDGNQALAILSFNLDILLVQAGFRLFSLQEFPITNGYTISASTRSCVLRRIVISSLKKVEVEFKKPIHKIFKFTLYPILSVPNIALQHMGRN